MAGFRIRHSKRDTTLVKENIRRNHTKWLISWILPRRTWRASASHALICRAEQPQSEWFLSLMCCATNSMFPINQKAANRDQQRPISASSAGHTAEMLVSYSVFVLSTISEQSALCLCFVLMFTSKGPGVCRWSPAFVCFWCELHDRYLLCVSVVRPC